MNNSVRPELGDAGKIENEDLDPVRDKACGPWAASGSIELANGA